MRYTALFLIALCLTVTPLTAATNSPARSPQAGATEFKGRGLPFHGTVASVDKVGKTITMEGKKQRVFHITPETKIHKDKVASNFNAVVAGATVGGYAREMPDGKQNLVTLNVTSTPSKPPKPAK